VRREALARVAAAAGQPAGRRARLSLASRAGTRASGGWQDAHERADQSAEAAHDAGLRTGADQSAEAARRAGV
jgi:hypothetical protein